jgi:hypothetical protein
MYGKQKKSKLMVSHEKLLQVVTWYFFAFFPSIVGEFQQFFFGLLVVWSFVVAPFTTFNIRP